VFLQQEEEWPLRQCVRQRCQVVKVETSGFRLHRPNPCPCAMFFWPRYEHQSKYHVNNGANINAMKLQNLWQQLNQISQLAATAYYHHRHHRHPSYHHHTPSWHPCHRSKVSTASNPNTSQLYL